MVGTASTAGLLTRVIGWACEERQARWAARIVVALIVVGTAYNASLLLSASWRDRMGYGAVLDRRDQLLILVTLFLHTLAAFIVLGRVGAFRPFPSYGLYRVGSWVFGVWFGVAGALGVSLGPLSRALTISAAILVLIVAGSPDPRHTAADPPAPAEPPQDAPDVSP